MRRLATFCFAFAFGIFAAQYLLARQVLLGAAAGLAVLGVLWALSLHEDRRRRALLIGFGISLALCWDWAYIRMVCDPFEACFDSRQTLTLELADYPSKTEYGSRAEVTIPGSGLHGKAILYADAEILELVPGTRLTAPVEIRSAASVRGQEISTHTARGVFALLYMRGDAEVDEANAGSARYLPQRFAHALERSVEQCFPARTAPFLKAILLGDRYELSAEDGTRLSEAGLYHITAVSGLHCAFIVSFLGFLIGKHRRALLSAAAIPVLALYALSVGLTPSIVRACVMLALYLLAPLFARESDGLTSLSFALFLLLGFNPFSVKSVSLQLSFAAMSGIILLTPRLYERVERKEHGRFARFMLGSLAATAGALVFTIPLTACYFDLLVLIAPLSNLLCLWAAALTFASGLVTTLIALFFPGFAHYLAYVPHCGATYLLTAADLLSRIPYHAVYFTNDYLKYWLGYVYALFAVCVAVKRGRRRYAAAALLAVLTLALILWLNAASARSGALRVAALDVGQGQCAALISHGSAALVDCGSKSHIDAGAAAANYFRDRGIRSLDLVVLSHYHGDHCNGLASLLARMRVKRLVLPDIEPEDENRAAVLALADRYGLNVIFVREAWSTPLGLATLTVYPPVTRGEMNEECLTSLCSAGSFDVLFTGDMDANSENRLIAENKLPDVEVLVAGHHGSRASTGKELLAELTPETVIVSCGAGNSYGHPHEETLRRIVEAGAEIYRTDWQGTICVSVR
ncbi:MAG: ComEC/Rec2 family competence protein [Oscillospiraceae bacterium]|nr:ComEC/Rec2 family competence protein [Oscillospiraceae bacterium]